jgi:hypothetical protein
MNLNHKSTHSRFIFEFPLSYRLQFVSKLTLENQPIISAKTAKISPQ